MTAQEERTGRARAAICTGKFLVTRTAPLNWTVQNGDRLPYTVSLQPSSSGENQWTCTCMDFQQRGPEIFCKHIESVRLLEAAQNQNDDEKEDRMSDLPLQDSDVQSTPDTDVETVLNRLRQPLDMARIKYRQAPGNDFVPYLEGCDIIERANRIFDFAWSFELLGEPVISRWQKKGMVWNQQEKRKVPVVDIHGHLQMEDVGIVYVSGQVTVELEGKQYHHADLGHCIFSGDSPEALALALTDSATDCLKRCFRQMGEQFGSRLYDLELAQPAARQATSRPAAPPARVVRKYADGEMVNGNVSEQEAFDRFKTKMGKAPASKADLRTWLAGQRNTKAPVSVSA